MLRKYLLAILFCFMFFYGYSRLNTDTVWTLEASIAYALEHNIDIQQSTLNIRLADLQLQQSRLSQLPSVSAGLNYGRSLGRSVDPTSNMFINSKYDFAGLSGNADVLLFGWFQKRNQIEGNRLLRNASMSDMNQLKDDIALNVATGFLRILLAREQVEIGRQQIELTQSQYQQTVAFVEAERSPTIDLAQISAQLATDSANFISMLINYDQAVLEMKALMNFELSTSYYAQVKGWDTLSVNEMILLNPDDIYISALRHFGGIEAAQFKVEAAEKNLHVVKAGLLPQLGLGAQWGSNYSTTIKDFSNISISGVEPTGGFVKINNQDYLVYQHKMTYSDRITPLPTQLSNNFRHTYALSLSIPIFNGWAVRRNLVQAKIDIESKNLELQRTQLRLKQNVYAAYYEAKAAVQKYYSAKKAAEAAQYAHDLAKQRYELGLLNTVEMLTTQNNFYRAKIDVMTSKYDMVFKTKVIDYYMGKKLKL